MRNQLINKRLFVALVVLSMLAAAPAALAAEEGGSPLDALGINAGFLLAQAINFGLIFGLLMVFLWRPLVNMLDSRSAKIQKGLEDAAAAANARMNAEAEAAKVLAAARAEAQSIIDEARGRADDVGKGIETEARGEAESIRAQARQAAVDERNQQLAGLRSQVAQISVAVAERLIGQNLDQQRQQALVSDFFTNVPDSAKGLSGNVEVVSAMPLDEAEQNRVRQQVGGDSVTFTVDPSILGGLIIRSGDRVVDGSIRRGLGEVGERLS